MLGSVLGVALFKAIALSALATGSMMGIGLWVMACALPLANAESGTTAWFALKFGPSTFGVFDAFADETGRQAHLNGQIAAALMANAATLLSSPPNIEKVELLAAKLPA